LEANDLRIISSVDQQASNQPSLKLQNSGQLDHAQGSGSPNSRIMLVNRDAQSDTVKSVPTSDKALPRPTDPQIGRLQHKEVPADVPHRVNSSGDLVSSKTTHTSWQSPTVGAGGQINKRPSTTPDQRSKGSLETSTDLIAEPTSSTADHKIPNPNTADGDLARRRGATLQPLKTPNPHEPDSNTESNSTSRDPSTSPYITSPNRVGFSRSVRRRLSDFGLSKKTLVGAEKFVVREVCRPLQ